MKEEYTEITAENWEQFKGMYCDAIIDKYILENWDQVRIKNVEEVKPRRINTDTHIQIPSNLTKAEAEEALKRASEGEVEVDRWYLCQDPDDDYCVRYLTKNKKWRDYKNNNGYELSFGGLHIISPMIVEKEQG